MKPCSCGQPVRLRAQRITVNRRRGVRHWIEHLLADSPKRGGVCVPGDWATVMLKPYPKAEADRPRVAMIQRWEHLATRREYMAAFAAAVDRRAAAKEEAKAEEYSQLEPKGQAMRWAAEDDGDAD